MGEKKPEENATRYPFPPFFGRRQTVPLVPFTKLSVRYPGGKMGEIENVHKYPKIRVPRRFAVGFHWALRANGRCTFSKLHTWPAGVASSKADAGAEGGCRGFVGRAQHQDTRRHRHSGRQCGTHSQICDTGVRCLLHLFPAETRWNTCSSCARARL